MTSVTFEEEWTEDKVKAVGEVLSAMLRIAMRPGRVPPCTDDLSRETVVSGLRVTWTAPISEQDVMNEVTRAKKSPT